MKNILFFSLIFILGVSTAYIFQRLNNHTRTNSTRIASFLPEKITPTKSAFSLENSPRESLRATISTMSGEIHWESRTATEPAMLLDMNTVLQQGEKLVASDSGNITITFSDTSEVNLHPKTIVEIVQTLPINLVFNQLNGDAEYLAKDHQFTVRMLNLLVSFSQAKVSLAFDDKTGKITLAVISGGAVAAYNDVDFVSQRVFLREKDHFVFDNEKRTGNSF